MLHKIMALCLFFCILLHADEIYFMPYEKKEALMALQKQILSAKKSIKIAIFSFTNKELAKVLKQQAQKGVQISIIYDLDSNYNSPYSTIGYLAKLQNINACTLQGLENKKGVKKYYGIMHQKLVIIDEELVVLGSANWSKNAFENNYENLLITNQKNIVQKANYYYAKMLKSCKAF
ncbi:phospholipase D-like domain-containing protein [Helicobacter anatolicus]|uniref:phospholipase D-like domain-containing protein n=1 Tax=Helicobacter anatolicus TaxID=2905874 RepID=UPI001E40745B|nr:phospholipase D-like domain-containing protein [Helicobacter anatolicus]MCE3039493.1 phospholipase D-like domain-containing protein [Helicobacter anatolicus]